MSKNTKPKMCSFKIRFAQEKDAEIIFCMIKELAEYEKLQDKLEATAELVKESLFQRKVAETLIAEYAGKPVGYAIFFQNFSSFLGRSGIYIEDIYVKPEMRDKGFGKMLFSFIAQLAVKRKCGRLEWLCLDWNTPSIAFYKKMGAETMQEWTVYRISGKKLTTLAEQL